MYLPCDQNIRLDPQYTAKSVTCTKTRVEGTREEEGQWEMGKGEERAARTTTEADLAGGPTLGLQTFTVVGNCGRMYFASVH